MIKTYASLGPTCCTVDTIRPMLAKGLTGLRLNLSHGALEPCLPWIDAVHTAAALEGVNPELIFDTQGSETRTGVLEKPMLLQEGQSVKVGREGIPVDADVIEVLTPGQAIVLANGAIELRVEKTGGASVLCRVTQGGELGSQKSLYLPGAFPNRPVLSAKDRRELPMARECGATAVMHPFIRRRQDLTELRAFLKQNDLEFLRIFAKVEDPTGVENLADWLDLCDEVVIARGDLGTSVPLWELPRVQKEIAKLCREGGKAFMVATEMLDSMTRRPEPTRAEVLDIYNACLDGAASVMLTGETASGDYPVESVDYLLRVVREAEKVL
jgi:pyruvate kinase